MESAQKLLRTGKRLEVRGGSGSVESLSTKNDTLETSDMPGGQIPGDSNQDTPLNLSDALHLASIVFLGDSSNLPCRGRVETIPNHTLLDVSGDKPLDGTDVIWLLNYIFLNGVPPALGSTCLEIEDCPPVCG